MNNIQEQNYQDILKSSSTKIYEMAQTDPATIVVSESKPSVGNNLDVPTASPIKDSLKTVVATHEILEKGEQNAPQYLVSEDPVSSNYTVHDESNDIQLNNLFYANRATGTCIHYANDKDGRVLFNSDDSVVTYMVKRKIYFNRSNK